MKALADIKVLLIVAAVVLLALLAGLWFAYDQGKAAGTLVERSAWQATERTRAAAVDKLKADHAADLEAQRKKNIANNLKVSETHEQEIQILRHERDADRAAFDRAGGLRISAAEVCAGRDRPGASTEAPGAGGRDEASASTVRLPLEVENHLWGIVNDADEVSGQLRACQSWIRTNGFYGNEDADSAPLLDRMIAEPNHPAEDTIQ